MPRAGVPRHGLNWHYRSRHESLIAFSNHRYYDGKLITFPAAVTRASAVSWRRINGVYSKGLGRTNPAEAEAMVAEAVQRLTDPQFIADGKTLAIITLNAEQQKLVEDLLDKARQDHPQIERFFSEDIPEPVVVKNLETVQGDERDLIMLGIGYGPDGPGATTMSMNFGPLNRDGGWRRLNVAITRARQEMMVFTSFDPSMVDLNRTNARAVRDLKHFIEFADRGPQALAEAVHGSLGGYESAFEQAVAQGLMRLGWNVVPQIGVSRFRIDLGIVHPDRAGDYLVGVECDGATYHSAATARDRDKVRAGVLQGLGWKLLRVWSTEWWVDKAGALQRLHAAIEALLEKSRAEWNEKVEQRAAAAKDAQSLAPERGEAVLAGTVPSAQKAVVPTKVAMGIYRITDFSALAAIIDPVRFYDVEYDGNLAELISHVIATESPIMEGLLVQRITRAHLFQKAGRLIRERVLELAERHHHLRDDPIGGRCVWQDEEAIVNWHRYRTPASEEAKRNVDDIPFEELRAASLSLEGEDPALEMARAFGIQRLSAVSRQRLETALDLARNRSASAS